MNHAVYALLLFTGWTFLLVVAVFLYRGIRVLGGTAINSWPRGNKSVGDAPLVTRIADAHANCLENLPIFAVLVLAAHALGQTDVTNKYAPFVLWARIAQSSMHLLGTSVPLVMARATFWAMQLVCFGIMFVSLLA